MGLFEKIFSKQEANKVANTYFQELNGYVPVFNSWNGKLYESELVRSAIDARARHISKLSVKPSGSAQPITQTKLRKAPNSYQTWGQFLYRASTILDMQGTCFIVPSWDGLNNIVAVNVIKPMTWTLVTVDKDNEPWLRFSFANGNVASCRLSEVGILTRFQYEDDYFGTKNDALADTMELINIQNQGIKEAVKSSSTYRFMARVTNFTKPDDLAKERERFSTHNLNKGSGGLLLFPNTYGDIQQIKSTPYTVDIAQKELIQTNVFNYFGVNLEIMQNKATVDQMDAFFNGAIEPFEIQLAEVMTRMIFTDREIENGSKINITASRLQYMTTTSKIQLAKDLGDRGFITINEVRELFNYPALPAEIGDKMPIRGEYYNVGEEKGNEQDNSGQAE